MLRVRAEAQTDFFVDPDGSTARASAHLLHFAADGDFDLSARVAVDMASPYDSACLMVVADEAHWAKVCYEFWHGVPSIVSVVTRGYSDDAASHELGARQVYLRVLRSRNAFGLHYSLNARAWKIVRYFHLDAPSRVRVGFAAQCPLGEGCDITFSDVRFAPGRIKDARRMP